MLLGRLFRVRTLRTKLVFLAGIPALGALLLSLLIAQAARERAQSAAALGSIQDLADLTVRMTRVIHAVQMERAQTALATGLDRVADPALETQRSKTDVALRSLDAFLAGRNLGALPPRLSRGLSGARQSLANLAQFRREAVGKQAPIEKTLEFYGGITRSLVDATAALGQLSDDGELLRSISALVATLQLKERASQEHALLANVFALGEFPPGTYRFFVTLLTEEAVYADALRNAATDAQYNLHSAAQKAPAIVQAAQLRDLALNTIDEELKGDAELWFRVDTQKIEALRRVEISLNEAIERAALAKITETRRSLRTTAILVGSVILSSVILALVIGRGVARSVAGLTQAAASVRRNRDYTVRAHKVSEDELGMLTDAFNEMLAGIEGRDRELEQHRRNLEAIVAERTAELSRRNEEMRLVLDNVDQGFVTVDRNGVVSAERSRAFNEWFGAWPAGTHFADCLGQGNADLSATISLAYEQVVSEVFPVEAALDQLPKQFEVQGVQYALALKPLLRAGSFEGALVVVTDVTADLRARAVEAQQREQASVFSQVMHDRTGFVEFFQEMRGLLQHLRDDGFATRADELRTVHTIKGNAGLFGVSSVADAAHALEQAIVDDDQPLTQQRRSALLAAWDVFAARIVPVLGESGADRIDVTAAELDAILEALGSGQAPAKIAAMLQRLRLERIELRFERIAAQVSSLSRRVGKDTPEVSIESNDVRLDSEPFARFWSACAHVVRNIVDHGFEREDERVEVGKPPRNRLRLAARSRARDVEITMADDGRGIDWIKIAERARAAGMASATHADLVRALLSPAISSTDVVTEYSGRGVGLAEVDAACRALSGSIAIESEPGKGSSFRFTLPLHAAGPRSVPPRLTSAPISQPPTKGLSQPTP
jgi:two-component system chemotaxis sensor kinase CheA